jgi:hypothetical protein
MLHAGPEAVNGSGARVGRRDESCGEQSRRATGGVDLFDDPSRNFSHTRGTPKNRVGRQERRSSATVVKLRANQVSAPPEICPKWLMDRSVM